MRRPGRVHPPVLQKFFGSPLVAFALAGLGCVGSVGSEGGGAAPGPNGPADGTNRPSGMGGPANPGPGNSPGNPGNNAGPGAGPGGSPSPSMTGRPPIRRLTQTQFSNTVQDLLGFDGDHAAGFVKDEDGTGFRANTNAPISGAQVDKYEQAADKLGARVAAEAATRIAPCAGGRNEADCANDFVRGFGKRAFRRPLTDEEVARYRSVFDAGQRADGSYAAGIGLVVTAMLQSPHFLYLPEVGEGSGGALVPLGGWEMASRLSYFIQDTMPDAELFAAAEAGKLKTPEEITSHTKRLLGSPRARAVQLGFFKQWLELEALPGLDKDVKAYPVFSPELRTAMNEEVDAFVNHVMSDGGKLGTLLTAGVGFPKGALAEVYGLTAAGTGARVDLPAGQRAGIMTLPGMMALYAHPDQSAPVSRGYIVSEKMLCQTPPQPPDDLEFTLPKPDPNRTTRERFAAHRENPSCAGCHALMDPYGLTFENYDGIGRWRDREGNRPVDATSKLDKFGDVKNAVELMAKMSTSKEVISCMTRQWFRLAFGRNEGEIDKGTLAAAQEAFERAELRMTDLVVALATSPAFRQRPQVTR